MRNLNAEHYLNEFCSFNGFEFITLTNDKNYKIKTYSTKFKEETLTRLQEILSHLNTDFYIDYQYKFNIVSYLGKIEIHIIKIF